MIKSYTEVTSQDLVLLLQETPFSGTFLEVKLTNKQFEDICKIVNKAEEGFDMEVYQKRLEIVEHVDVEDD